MKLDPYFKQYTNGNWKWINDLNARTKAIKILEEYRGLNLHDLEFANGVRDIISKARAIRTKST